MFASLIHTTGPLFLAACALEFVAVATEQAGAARSPEEDERRHGLAALALLVVTAATPGVLLLHGFLATHGADPMLRVLAMAAPLVAMTAGALAGGVVGLARGVAPAMRKAAIWLGVASLALAVFAARPSLETLIAAAQRGAIEIPAE